MLFFVGKLNFNDQGRKPRHALCTLILPWVLFLHASRFFLIIFYTSCIQYHMMKKYFKMSLKRTSCRNDFYLLHHSDSRLINLYPFIIGIACVCVFINADFKAVLGQWFSRNYDIDNQQNTIIYLHSLCTSLNFSFVPFVILSSNWNLGTISILPISVPFLYVWITLITGRNRQISRLNNN